MTPTSRGVGWHEMKMAMKGSEVAALKFTSIIVCAVLLRQGAPEKTGE